MADSAEDAPLSRGSMAGSEEVLIAPAASTGGSSNSRAFKVAGLTTLACLLLASQVFTAFMVFDQKQQIHSLQKNSERLGKQLTRSSQAAASMRLPMNSLPLLMDFSNLDIKTTKKPLTVLQDTVASVETQLKDLMQDSKLPQFNETFLDNLQNLRQHMNESEWKSFESWMRYWLIFQMSQQEPATPTPESASVIKTKCQVEAAAGSAKIGSYKPQCDEQGNFMPMQCWHPTGYCWCVDKSGTVIEGTSMRGRPDCQRAAVFPRHMLSPRLMQKTINIED
ncbi:CD74 molecule, major histocompatibility complex, class II invariant chain a [Cottoperca gobio]|uniref:CD74 molecule, major histocompatibility complex, class II invariant chain a n=1 Tax=Cottoperca gobio TaxID=56716 RepID=A0A6J2QG31_COTGO|nr:HLA class II histocompatibility antigen gamma chain [Cottoperca gobio]